MRIGFKWNASLLKYKIYIFIVHDYVNYERRNLQCADYIHNVCIFKPYTAIITPISYQIFFYNLNINCWGSREGLTIYIYLGKVANDEIGNWKKNERKLGVWVQTNCTRSVWEGYFENPKSKYHQKNPILTH